MMDITTYFYIWLGGASMWCILMSAQGDEVDRCYIFSAIVWPVMLLHIIGQILRKVLK
jgi:hypothetical protein